MNLPGPSLGGIDLKAQVPPLNTRMRRARQSGAVLVRRVLRLAGTAKSNC